MTKKEQRQIALAARRALSPEARRAASEAICEALLRLPALREAGLILSYRALYDEADLAPLEKELRAQIAYPRCLSGGEMEARLPTGPLRAGPYGISEPDPAASVLIDPAEIELVLVPCVGFDAALRRLGHGAGYYDRFLPRCPRALRVAAAFSCQELRRVVTDPYDQKMDIIVTERGVFPRHT